ncbi:RsmB/NOP family class I SAM-dependent RNA methyltransferase [Staphylospora marina]|uniref:RsmB/NOP family class I SAM-dependent RNA methyltransferase n=1 Tax=Staphylospora marina TaxID=2490858 RepID=UPI000F5BAAFB|nr:RsmB/NOP family class I SAM-dependent RNA methyltransferase [Staphylospora marina]
MVSLPEAFLTRMQELLKEEFPEFLRSYEEEPWRGLRVNTLKIRPDELSKRVPFTTDPVPWCPEAFYLKPDAKPGKHPYHAAGLYYIQDPSAMSPAEALDPQPGETVLDLCAAPGGKTTQIAARMQGKGLLVANEIDRDRVKVLTQNLERCGVANAVVLNEHPARLSERFAGFFDRILVDAPCSGEGMFRKDDDVMKRWSPKLVEKSAELQLDILRQTAPMLKPGGRLVYSTCTFNPRENEGIIESFLREHPEFAVRPVPQAAHYRPGRPDWVDGGRGDLSQTARLWPHHLKGEGHFVAVLEKTDGPEGTRRKPGKPERLQGKALAVFRDFLRDTFRDAELLNGPFVLFGEHLYLMPPDFPSIKGIRVEWPGRWLGQVKKGRFIPSHALALSIHPDQVWRTVDYSVEDPELIRYLRGDTLTSTQDKGWAVVTVDGFPLGWAKISGGLLKNHYPKGLRLDRY